MKNCDTILAKHVIAITKQDLTNLVVANEAVDMKADNLIPENNLRGEDFRNGTYLKVTVWRID